MEIKNEMESLNAENAALREDIKNMRMENQKKMSNPENKNQVTNNGRKIRKERQARNGKNFIISKGIFEDSNIKQEVEKLQNTKLELQLKVEEARVGYKKIIINGENLEWDEKEERIKPKIVERNRHHNHS